MAPLWSRTALRENGNIAARRGRESKTGCDGDQINSEETSSIERRLDLWRPGVMDAAAMEANG